MITVLLGVELLFLAAGALVGTRAFWPAFFLIGAVLLVLGGVALWRRTGLHGPALLLVGAGAATLLTMMAGFMAVGALAVLGLAVWLMLIRPFRRN